MDPRDLTALKRAIKVAIIAGRPVANLFEHLIANGGTPCIATAAIAGKAVHIEALECLWRAANEPLLKEWLFDDILMEVSPDDELRLLEWIEVKNPDVASWRATNIWRMFGDGESCRWLAERADLQSLALRGLDLAPCSSRCWPKYVAFLRGLGPNTALEKGLLRVSVAANRADVVEMFAADPGAARALCLADGGAVLRCMKKPSKRMAAALRKIKLTRSDLASAGLPRAPRR